MLKTLLSNQELIRKLLAKAQASIAADEFGATDWDKGRLSVFDDAWRLNPDDLRTWAMKGLEWQETESSLTRLYPDTVAHSLDYSEGCEAGYRNIIDELCVHSM
jgi:hypothetical protein